MSVDAMAATNVKGGAAIASGYTSGEADNEEYGQDVVYPINCVWVEWSDKG